MTTREIYNTNEEFKGYMERYLRSNQKITLEEAFKHKIIQNIAQYYADKDTGKTQQGNYSVNSRLSTNCS